MSLVFIYTFTISCSLGISEAEIEGQISKSERQFRLEAIHIRGFDGNIVRSEDIHEYFLEFSPVSFEWVDNNSANVIWALPSSAAKALLTMSRPLKQNDDQIFNENSSQPSQVTQEDDDEMVDIRRAEETEQKSEEPMEEESTRMKNQKIKAKILEKFLEPHTESINVSEIGIKVPLSADVNQWRIGKPNDKLGVTVFMRIATRHDTAMVDGTGTSTESSHLSFEDLRQKNIKLKTSGGIISNSRKRKMQEVMLAEKVAAEEQEATKKYNGPVGKNPWGTIAEDWAVGSKKGEKDFAEELGELANLVGGKKNPISARIGEQVSEPTGTASVHNMDTRRDPSPTKYPIITRRVPQTFTDWDAPENDGVVVTSFCLDENTLSNNRKRKRDSGAQDLGTGIAEKNQDLKWSKRLKRPRMQMVADELESKLSAKTRLYKGIQRRIDRPEVQRGLDEDRVEIYEEDEEEDNGYHKNDINRRKSEPIFGDGMEGLKMSIKINNSKSTKNFSEKNMSERFPTRKGISPSLRERLGDGANNAQRINKKDRDRRQFGIERREPSSKNLHSGFRGYDSGDSLEMDQGDDLRGELDGQHAANMVIQVSQSPQKNETDRFEEESNSDEEMEDDRRQESHIASVVAKIKTEKNIKQEPRDRNHREHDIQRHEKPRDGDRERQERGREKEGRNHQQPSREKEILERERLRRERHRQIEERKAHSLRSERDEARLAGENKRDIREYSKKAERKRDDSFERAKSKRGQPMRIKKEKLSDDEKRKRKGSLKDKSSSEDDSSSSSSSSSDESSSDSSSSESDSDSSESHDSSSSSSDSSTEPDSKKKQEGPLQKKRKLSVKSSSQHKPGTNVKPHIGTPKVQRKRSEDKGKATKASKLVPSTKARSDKRHAVSKSDGKKKDDAHNKKGDDNTGLRDKLKDYLKKAKERRNKEKDVTKD